MPKMPAQPTSAPLRFRSQRPNEELLLETRRHWWSWVRWFPIPVLIVLASIILAGILPPIGVFVVLVALIVSVTFMLYLYADWINDSIIITDQRIVRITRDLLRFSEQVSEIPLTSIQEIQADIPNWDPFALAFQYGYVALKTSGSAGDVKLAMIPDPDGMQDLILTDYSMRRQSTQNQEQADMRRNIERWVAPGNAHQDFANMPIVNDGAIPTPPWSPFIGMYRTAHGGVIYRKHWWVWLKKTFVPILLLIAGVIALVGLQIAGLGVIGLGISFVMLIVGAAWFWWQDVDFRNDYMIVTDSTITLMHQKPLWLQNERDVLLLKRVDNIIAESQGLFNQMLNIGTLRFALIGGDYYKEFTQIGHPLEIQADLARRQGIAKRSEREQQEQGQEQKIGQYMAMYHEMVGQSPQQMPPQQQPVPQPAVMLPPIQPQRDGQRPPIVPSGRPAMTQGRPYVPQPPPGAMNYAQPPQPYYPPQQQYSAPPTQPVYGQAPVPPQPAPYPPQPPYGQQQAPQNVGQAPQPPAPPPLPPAANRPPRFRRSE